MEFLNKWERKLGWMSFPGLLRYCALMQVAVFLLQIINPEVGQMLDFDASKILSGEVWRLLTFLFAGAGYMGLGALPMVAIYFTVIIAFLCSDGLEEAWGTFRTSMFCYTGIASMLVANCIFSALFGFTIPATGMMLYGSAFFAFATLFPKVELLLFMVLPVQVRWIALFQVVLVGSAFLKFPLILLIPLLLLIVIPAHLNYLLWAGIPALRGQARVVKAAGRRRKFEKTAGGGDEAFHRCVKCDRTEVSDPDLEFRMSGDGREYCEDHLVD